MPPTCISMLDHSTIAFIVAATVLTITPGNDTMLIIRNSVARNRENGFTTMFGILSGLIVHGSFAALGLSVILMKSATVFGIVKYIGAAFLVILGVMSLRSAWQSFRQKEPVSLESRGAAQPEASRAGRLITLLMGHNGSHPGRRAFVEGFFSNVLNPKVALFYLSFLPQFIAPSDPLLKPLFLAGIHILMGVIWLSMLILLIGKLRHMLARPRNKAVMESVAGTVLIGFGVRLALER